MLDAIKRNCPEFFNYAVICYGGHTALRGNGFKIPSAQGTQQGDACGPPFFSVAIHDLVTRSSRSLSWVKWYMHEGTLCGTPHMLEEALVNEEAPSIGLRVNAVVS